MAGTVAILPNFGHHIYISEHAPTHLNTLATEAIDYVHSVTQKTTLAMTMQYPSRSRIGGKGSVKQSALHFNTNLRFFTASRGPYISFFHPNGTFYNLVMAFLLILSYPSVSISLLDFPAIECSDEDSAEASCAGIDTWDSISISFIPVLNLIIVLSASSLKPSLSLLAFDVQKSSRGVPPLSATYGHIQTLVNLIDRWDPGMKM